MLSAGKGRIEVILGPMFSGKTTELIRRITRFQFAKFNCIVFKYAGDVRYSDKDASTHDQRTISAISATMLLDHISTACEYDVIGIDEGQFFPDLIAFSEQLANKGKTLIVAALDGTFERKGFKSVLEIIPLAESVVKLSAVCVVCCGDASFTQRISDDINLELIGGADKYRAVCRDCYRGTPCALQRKRTPLKEMVNGDHGPLSPPKRSILCDTEIQR